MIFFKFSIQFYFFAPLQNEERKFSTKQSAQYAFLTISKQQESTQVFSTVSRRSSRLQLRSNEAIPHYFQTVQTFRLPSLRTALFRKCIETMQRRRFNAHVP